jgi:trimethylamine:corrinoid methyltransferase-like protein
MRQRAREKALDILANHRPEPLPLEVQEKLDRIVEETH